MSKNPYTPTPEQAARYAEEMEYWRDAVLVNKEYYDQLVADMKQIEEKEGRYATVKDMREAMQRHGNLPYVMAYDYLDKDNAEVPFEKIEKDHDDRHIFIRMPHTPESEQRMVYADAAGKYIMGFGYDGQSFEQYVQSTAMVYKEIDQYTYRPEERHRLVMPLTRDKAIDFALSWYFKDKCFLAHELYHTQTWEEMAEQVRNYANNDHVSRDNMGKWVEGGYPYEMLLLSDKERESIIAVATGLKTPEETPYPNRMKRVYEALKEIGLLNDLKPWAERAVKNQAENHPKGEGFDPEKFKAARDKRGADTKER